MLIVLLCSEACAQLLLTACILQLQSTHSVNAQFETVKTMTYAWASQQHVFAPHAIFSACTCSCDPCPASTPHTRVDKA